MKKALLSIVLSVLILFFGFVVVGTTLDAKITVPEPKCTEHVDENADKLCDKCGADLTCKHEFVEAEKVEPTCAEEGHEAGLRCKLCGEWYFTGDVDGAIIEKLPHTPVYETLTPVDGLIDGTRKATCSVCGTVIAEEEAIPAYTLTVAEEDDAINGRDKVSHDLDVGSINSGVTIELVDGVYVLNTVNAFDEAAKTFYNFEKGAILLLTFTDEEIATKGYAIGRGDADETFDLVLMDGMTGALDGPNYLYLFFNGKGEDNTWTITKGEDFTLTITVKLAVAEPAVVALEDEVEAPGTTSDVDVDAPAEDEVAPEAPVEEEKMITVAFNDWLFGLVGLSVATNPWLTKVVTYGSLALLIVFAIVLGAVLAKKAGAPTDKEPKKAKMTKAQRRELREEKKRQKAAKAQKVNATKGNEGTTETRTGRTTHMKF